jgi:precorrin-2 dehydrogenase / sirohydrochlorin ferrochelatase
MSLFPLFLKLDGKLAVVIGGGVVAQGKIEGLLASEARVRVVAPQITKQIAGWVRFGRVEWLPKEFAAGDLDGATLAVAATSAPGVNSAVFAEAQAKRILCNAVDDVENCDFYYGAVARRGDLQIAISTNGKSPALAQRIRKELEQAYPAEYGEWLEWLGAVREILRADSNDPEQTKALLHQLATRECFERYLQQARNRVPQEEVA